MPSGAGVIEYRGKRGVVFRIKYSDADGRQVMETLGPAREGWTRRKAEAELRDRLVKVQKNGWRRPEQLTFREHADRWIEDGVARGQWRSTTVKAYRVQLRRFVDYFGEMPLATIRPSHVAAYIAEASKKLAPATVIRDVDVLYAIFNTGVRLELIERNPAATVERPRKPVFQPALLEPHEIRKVAAAFTDEQARTVFLTLVLTGVRRSELQALRWRDVDLVENVLRVRESKSHDGIRSIAVSPTLAEALWQHRRRSHFQGDDELVFCHTERGSVYHETIWRKHFTVALKAAGVTKKLRQFHDLRHTAITNDAATGSSPIAVMTKAGHANIATTKRYMHLAGVVFRDEAEALERRLLGGGRQPLHDPRDHLALDRDLVEVPAGTDRDDLITDDVAVNRSDGLRLRSGHGELLEAATPAVADPNVDRRVPHGRKFYPTEPTSPDRGSPSEALTAG
jgi:integrase